MILTEVAWDFITKDATRAVHLSDNMARFRACKDELFGLLSDKIACDTACLCQAHHQVNVVVEGDLSSGRCKHVEGVSIVA